MTDAPTNVQINPLADDGFATQCMECFWYSGNVLSGICRGAPPVPVVIGVTQDLAGNTQPRLGTYFPVVSSNQFCGAFRPERDKALQPLQSTAEPAPVMPEDMAGSA